MKTAIEPTVVEFKKKNGRTVYEMGVDLDTIMKDTQHGCPVEIEEVASYRAIPLKELKKLFEQDLPTFDNAYSCIKDPKRSNVYFMGSPNSEN